MLIKFDYYLAIALGLISLTYFYLTGNMSAFTWPSIDMGPFFERYNDSSFLLNDFFTNVSALPNPRHIFGYFIIALTTIFSTDWYTIFFGLKTLLIIMLPVLFYWTIVLITADKINKNNKTRLLLSVIVFLGTVAVLYHKVAAVFSVAWWSPLAIFPAPQTLSLALGLLAIVLFYNSIERIGIQKTIVPILFFSATLIHPSLGAFCLIFLAMVNINRIFTMKKYWFCLFLFSVVLPGIILLCMYHVSEPLSAREFVKYYAVEHHSSHYLPSKFGSLTPWPWWLSFCLINSLMIFSAFFAIKKKDYGLLWLSLIFLLGYSGAVLIQYLFVELFPIKIIASLGPSRFTLFGYWMLGILYCLLLLNHSSVVHFFSLLKWTNKKNIIQSLPFKAVPVMLSISLIIVVVLIGGGVKDMPEFEIRNKHQKLYEWIQEEIPDDAVFAIYFDEFKIKFPLVMKRAVFIGNGFPFREDFFREYSYRNNLIYGSNEELKNFEGQWIGEKIAKFYRQLTPDDFLKISKKFTLDYVIIEPDYVAAFSQFVPLFSNTKMNIYATRQFELLNNL